VTGAVLALLLATSKPVLIVSDDPDGATARLAVAELSALGFETEQVRWDGKDLDEAALWELASNRAERTGVAVLLEPRRLGAWVLDRSSRSVRSRERESDEQPGSEITARKLAESMRALFLDPPRPVPVAPEPTPSPPPSEPRPSEPQLWVSMVGGALGAPGAVLGVVGGGVRAELGERLGVTVGVQTAPWPTRLRAEVGAVQLTSTRVSLGARVATLEAGSRLQLDLGLGAYAERVAAAGEADAPLEASTREMWTAGGSLGTTVALRMGHRLQLCLEAGASASPRTLSIIAADREVMRWGWFTWGAALGLEVGLWP